METTLTEWNVIDGDQAILTHKYTFNEAGGTAHTMTVRLAEGQLLVVSPGCGMSAAAFDELDTFGQVVAILAPTGFHHLGQKQWRERYPKARHFASTETAARIAKKGEPGLTFEPTSELKALLPDGIGFRDAPASKAGDTWLWAKSGDGYVFYSGDVLCNWDEFPGNFLLNFGWKMSGSGPGYSIFHLAQMAITKDKKAVLRAFLEDVLANPPHTMVVCHGNILSGPKTADRTAELIRGAL